MVRTLLILLLLLPACDPGLELRISERIPLPEPGAVTLAVLEDGRLAIGVPGGLLLGQTADSLHYAAIGLSEVPRVVGEAPDRLLLATPAGELVMMDSSADTVLAVDTVAGAPLLDVRGRLVFSAGASGEVMSYAPDSLSLLSAWAALGAPATAIAGSPEGDRIYEALAYDSDAEILTRDVQTGRVLRRSEFTAPIATLQADVHGNLVGVMGEGREAALLSLRPWGAELELRWRVRLETEPDRTALRISPAGDRVAVISHGAQEDGLRVLDAKTGDVLGHLSRPPLDAAFTRDGRLLLLYAGEILVVRR